MAGMSAASVPLLQRNSRSFKQCPCWLTMSSTRGRRARAWNASAMPNSVRVCSNRVPSVATTNKDLRILIQQGLFREDLFFRLNVVPLRLPPLRERIEDLPDLIRHFFALAEKDGLPPKKLDAQALARMKQHRWPGNVRELENLA